MGEGPWHGSWVIGGRTIRQAAGRLVAEASWPSVEEQLVRDNVPAGSALESLIRDNQDFSLLELSEASDRIGLPPWLRVHWRKQHPDLAHRPDDPALGYPLALKNLHAWMVTHPDLGESEIDHDE